MKNSLISGNNKNGKIICNLKVGEHLNRIQGLDYFRTACDYEVVGEYPCHYLIGIRYRKGLDLDYPNHFYTSVSKVSIYCGSVSLIKEDGSRVKAYQRGYSSLMNTQNE